MALVAASISVMAQVTFTAIEGSSHPDLQDQGFDKACDGNSYTKWCQEISDDVTKSYLVLEASEATYIEGFRWVTGGDSKSWKGRNPKEFTIYGSNDKTNWTPIYYQFDDDFSENLNLVTYTVYCNSKEQYKYFKLWVKDNKDASHPIFQIAEFKLLPAKRGVAFESGDAKAFDGSTHEKWQSATLPSSTVLKVSDKCYLGSYQFYSSNESNRYPTAWTVEGSNDNANWTTIDTKTDETVMGSRNLRPFNFEPKITAEPYEYYRFTITAAANAEGFHIPEVALRTIDVHEHIWVITTTAPTCVTDGYDTYTCSVCQATKKENIVPANGTHTYKDGYCTVCGTIDTNYMTANAEGFYELSNAHQLKWWGRMVEIGNHGINAKLMNDISLSGSGFGGINIPDGGTSFSGKFNGNGHWIQYLRLSSSSHNTAFLNRTENAEIYDLGFKDIDVIAYGEVQNTSVFVGNAKNTKISRCAVKDGEVHGHDHVAALVGNSEGTTEISDCLAHIGVHSRMHQAGGLVGTSTGLTITRCLFTGWVNNLWYSSAGVLALVDGTQNPTTISNNMVPAMYILSYKNAWRGIAHTNGKSCTLQNNYTVNTTLYGKEGHTYSATLTDPNDENGKQVDEATAKSYEHYANTLGWDMDNVWTITPNGYPTLRWMQPEGYNVIKMPASGHVTLYKENAIKFISDVQVITGQINGDYLTLTEQAKEIPAQSAIILKGNAGEYVTYVTAASAPALVGTNDLQGSTTPITSDGTYYALSEKDGKVGFYLVKNGVEIPAGKAFLKTASGAKAYSFDDVVTGINGVETDATKSETVIYNLAGQRVQRAGKGIYIVNGKKVLF